MKKLLLVATLFLPTVTLASPFEYKIESHKNPHIKVGVNAEETDPKNTNKWLESILNKRGGEGWEVIKIDLRPTVTIFYQRSINK